MGQKVNPIGFRVGIMEGWKSRWYASKKEFSSLLLEDQKLRKFIKEKYKFAGIPKVEIERTRDEVRVILHAARPGIIIGRKGQEVERLQNELQELVGRRINIKIEEIARPEIQAQLVAEDIAEQLAKRASFRRCMKRAMETTMEAGAKGIKIQLAGRLGGAEMARREKSIAGSIPLSTLRAKIDYGFTEAKTAQGHIGVQVWVHQGMYHEEPTDGSDAQEGQASKKPKRTYKR
jgi:small subunit ribosomal protein S3